MLDWRKLAVGTVLALVATPPLMFARPNAPVLSPQFADFAFISLERSLPFDPSENAPTISVEKTGTLPTKEGMLLQINTDPGNVHIFTDESGRISYRVRVEADAREPGAEDFVKQFTVSAGRTPKGISLDGSLPWRNFHGQFGVSYEIRIPRRYNVEVHTQGGNIEVQDIEGRIELFTEGGDITAGRVGSGTTTSQTRQPSTERVAAKLETLGGQIRIGDVEGTLRATTSGGHITAGNIDGDGILRTGGGQIRTGRISGVATLDTGGGNITARFNNDSAQAPADNNAGVNSAHRLRGASRMLSSEGDIVVYIPREMAATIDAVIDRDGRHRILADSSLPLKISDRNSESDLRTIHFEGSLNGGGEILHLKAVSGNIILKPGVPRSELSAAHPAAWMGSSAGVTELEPSDSDELDEFNDAAGLFAEFRKRILESWWGGVPVDASEMQKHLEHSVAPVYPDVARQAGIEGDVILRVSVSSEGRVTDLKVLDGPPILARAAVKAVQQWQYHTLKVNGQPTNVVTTLIVSFRLH